MRILLTIIGLAPPRNIYASRFRRSPSPTYRRTAQVRGTRRDCWSQHVSHAPLRLLSTRRRRYFEVWERCAREYSSGAGARVAVRLRGWDPPDRNGQGQVISKSRASLYIPRGTSSLRSTQEGDISIELMSGQLVKVVAYARKANRSCARADSLPPLHAPL